jgi:hypothetical protein
MNTRSGSQTNWQPRVPLEPVIQNNPQRPPPSGDQDRIAALEAQIETLNAELLQRRPRQPHSEDNREGHEEEDRNSNSNARREDKHQGIVPGKIIIGNKGIESPALMEVNRRMHEVWAELLPSWREGTRTWR